MRISPLKLSHGSPEGKSPKRSRKCLCRSVSAWGSLRVPLLGLLAQCAAVTGPRGDPISGVCDERSWPTRPRG